MALQKKTSFSLVPTYMFIAPKLLKVYVTYMFGRIIPPTPIIEIILPHSKEFKVNLPIIFTIVIFVKHLKLLLATYKY